MKGTAMKRSSTRAAVTILATALATVTAAAPGAAHVRVFADSANTTTGACGFAKFIVRVPVEKPIATTGVRVTIPRDVIVYGTQPKAGWNVKLDMDRGRIAAIEWSGGKLEPHEFEEFAFLAGTPQRAQTLSWDADQTYEDGSVVHWNGAPGSDTPHSQTTVTASGDCNEHRSNGKGKR